METEYYRDVPNLLPSSLSTHNALTFLLNCTVHAASWERIALVTAARSALKRSISQKNSARV